MKQALAYWFSFLFILLWMTSCGTYKHQRNRDKEEISVSQNSTIKENSTTKDTSNVKVKNETECNEESFTEKKTYTPVDPTKPSSFIDGAGNKKQLDNSSYTEEKTTTKKHGKSKTEGSQATGKNALIDKSKNDNLDYKSKGDHLAVHNKRTSLSWWNLLWLLLLIVVWLCWKYKSKIIGFWPF